MGRSEQRLRRAVDARLEPGEAFVTWTRAWVSRHQPLHWLLANRNRDYAVLTDRRVMLWSAGFFTRRPRRRVLADRLDEIIVESISRDPGRRVACQRPGRRALLLELGKDDRSDQFWIQLRDRAEAALRTRPVEPEAAEPAAPGGDEETSASGTSGTSPTETPEAPELHA
jgi:hypothetical protein